MAGTGRGPEEKLLSFQAFQSRCPPGARYGARDSWQRDFRRLRGITYLDHAGATLFAESLLKGFMDDLRENIYGNPHSQNISSKLTYDTIEHVRYSSQLPPVLGCCNEFFCHP